jgi:AcrR family transcriptional regulator
MTDQLEITARKRRPEARPMEILAAALDLFTERGFNATRLEDVASRAGLSKAAIYLYFNDKTALLTAVVQATVGANIGIASDMISKHQGPVAPLLQQLLGFMAGRMQETRMPDLIKLVISESRAHPEIGRFYLDNVIGRVCPCSSP